jgi:CHAT domain-containing protein
LNRRSIEKWIFLLLENIRMRRGLTVSSFVVLPTLALWFFFTSTVLTGNVHADVEAGHPANAPLTDEVVAELAPGHPIDQTLAPNETHNYEIKLLADRYLRLAVLPQGVDVVVTLHAPDGGQALKKISSYGTQGPVDACTVAREAGTYKIDVSATDNNAHVGRYRISIAELRKATPQDAHRSEAEEFLAQAQEQQAKGTLESKQLAVGKYAEASTFLNSAGDRLAEALSLEQLGSLHNDLGHNKMAVDLLRKSLQMFRLVRDRRGEGMAMSDLGSIESDLGYTKKALADLTEALRIRKEAGDQRGVAETLEYIGDLYEDTNESEKALENFNAALSLRRVVGDRRGEAQSLDDIGLVYYDTDEEQTALNYFRQALTIQQSLHDIWGEALTLNNFGVSYDSLGEKKKSLDYFSQTLPLKRAVGNRRGEAKTLSNMCTTESTLGEWQNAIDHCNAALIIDREIGDRGGEAATLQKMGLLNVVFGERQRALEQFEAALALARASGARTWEASVLNSIGLVFHEWGKFERARSNYNLALRLRRAIGDRTGEAATLNNIGRLFDAQGKKTIALDYFSQALRVARLASSLQWQAASLSNMAWLYTEQGKQQIALEHFSLALPLYRSIGDQRGEAAVLYGVALAERDSGNFTVALAQIELSLAIIETLRGKVIDQQLRTSYFSSTQRYYEFYIDLLMRLGRKDSTKGYSAAALGVSERSRARSLLDILQEGRASIRRGVDSDLLERERSLQKLLEGKRERHARLLSSKNQKLVATAEKEISDLLVEYQEVQAQIRAASPEYAALTRPQPLQLAEIQTQVLDGNTILLEYALGSDRSYLWAVAADSFASFELPKRDDVEVAARRVYDCLTARNRNKKGESGQQRKARLKHAELEYPKASLALSEMVLKPVAKLLPGKRLVIVADGALQYVPFGILPNPNGDQRPAPLVIDHEILTLPSVSVLGQSRQEFGNRKSAPKAIAVLADPVFDRDDSRVKSGQKDRIRQTVVEQKTREATQWGEPLDASRLTRSVADVGIREQQRHLPRLAFTRQEAKSILGMAPAGQGLEALDFAASRATAMSPDLGQYRMIHFATHGLLNSEHPDLSGLVLSLVDPNGFPVNGFLDLEDVYNLDLSADLVTLSACETGLGKDVRGEGLVGLTRGFMYAGAQRVVASLWKVDDVATAEFMGLFYRGMLREGLRPSEALRKAEAQMLEQKRWADPYYWGAFTIQGEWR